MMKMKELIMMMKKMKIMKMIKYENCIINMILMIKINDCYKMI